MYDLKNQYLKQEKITAVFYVFPVNASTVFSHYECLSSRKKSEKSDKPIVRKIVD